MDIYERHRQAVKEWRDANENVERAQHLQELAREELDNIGQELLASCADSKRIKPIVKRGRKAKTNGIKAINEFVGIRPNAEDHAE